MHGSSPLKFEVRRRIDLEWLSFWHTVETELALIASWRDCPGRSSRLAASCRAGEPAVPSLTGATGEPLTSALGNRPPPDGAAPRRRPACRHCGKTYSHRQSLFRHMQIHRGRTTCVICGDTLGTIIALKQHMKIRHPLHDA